MKIKVKELTGPVLDLIVAKCMGMDAVISDPYPNGSRSCIIYYSLNESGNLDGRSFCPSEHWSDGGHIIEQEKYSYRFDGGHSGDKENEWTCQQSKFPFDIYHGETMLIATMRCYVASKLGDEVEIPDVMLD